MKSVNLIFKCALCSNLLKVESISPLPRLELIVLVDTKCSCYSEAVEKAANDSLNNILDSVIEMAMGKGSKNDS